MSENRKTKGQSFRIPGVYVSANMCTPTTDELKEELDKYVKEYEKVDKKIKALEAEKKEANAETIQRLKVKQDVHLERILSQCETVLSRENARFNKLDTPTAKETIKIFKKYKTKSFSNDEAQKHIFREHGLGIQLMTIDIYLSKGR